MLVFQYHWGGLSLCPGYCAHRDRTYGCVLAHHSRCRDLILAVDAASNWVPVGSKHVPWVNLEMGSLLVCAEVDGQLGWRAPWLSSSLHIWAHLHCFAWSSKPRRSWLYCGFSCILYFQLNQWEFPPWPVLVLGLYREELLEDSPWLTPAGAEHQLGWSTERLIPPYMLLPNPAGRGYHQSQIYKGHAFGICHIWMSMGSWDLVRVSLPLLRSNPLGGLWATFPPVSTLPKHPRWL